MKIKQVNQQTEHSQSSGIIHNQDSDSEGVQNNC